MLVLLLAALSTFLLLSQARSDSPTYDEPVYVSAGLLALKEHDLAYNAEHPPLAKAIAAIPVLTTGATLPPGHVHDVNDERTYSAAFLRQQRRDGVLDQVTFASRLVPAATVLVVAALLFLLARQLAGRAAGLTAAALWLVSPLVIGLGHLDGVDLPFALAVVVLAGALLHQRHHPGRRPAVLLGVALGLCLATSMLGLVLVPVVVVLMLVQRRGAAGSCRPCSCSGRPGPCCGRRTPCSTRPSSRTRPGCCRSRTSTACATSARAAADRELPPRRRLDGPDVVVLAGQPPGEAHDARPARPARRTAGLALRRPPGPTRRVRRPRRARPRAHRRAPPVGPRSRQPGPAAPARPCTGEFSVRTG